MQNTTNYNLKKPEMGDYSLIDDINDNMDIIDQKLASPDGDARDEVVTFTDDDLDSGITSFPTFLSKIVSGMKIAKFFRDFKAGMQYVLHKGSLINNGTCNTAGEYALDAAYGKVLRDDIDSLNSSLSLAHEHLASYKFIQSKSYFITSGASETDCDNPSGYGVRYIGADTLHKPAAYCLLLTWSIGDHYVVQLAFQMGSTRIFYRGKSGSTWTDWVSLK